MALSVAGQNAKGRKTLEIRHAADIVRGHGADKLVLVASRRTDMPAFYTDELVTGLREGCFHPQAPQQAMFELRFRADDIHSIGLWSQDFRPWIRRRDEVKALGYRFWYRFSILPDDPVLKPGAPALDEQLRQLEDLVAAEGTEAIHVFVDPLAEYRSIAGGPWTGNCHAEAVEPIVKKTAELGLDSITLSVLDRYGKAARRARKAGIELRFLDPALPPDQEVMAKMTKPVVQLARHFGLKVRSCCERVLVSNDLTEKGSCVDGRRLVRLFGPGASTQVDRGQRTKHGCGCTRAQDIGRTVDRGPWSHACGHRCLQCYARP